jgi:hypothetical protein
MKKQDDIGITFVNSIAARGLFNNVANMSFSAYNFTPNDEGTVDPDPVIVCRLRMDKGCLMQLKQVATDLLKLMDETPQEAHAPEAEGVILKSSETSH